MTINALVTAAALAAGMLSPAVAAPAGTPAKAVAEKPGQVQLQMRVHIPMRDGTYLNATLFRPVGQTAPAPVVMMLTPYAGDASHPSAAYFAKYGMVYAFVDTRGRGDSSPGEFQPLQHEGQDGYDAVEWLAKQPWSNGQVVMFGGSYAGGDQWQVAAQHPPHLAAIAPVASVRAGVDWPMAGNMFTTYDVQWLTFTTGRTLYTNLFGDGGLWRGLNQRFFKSGKAYSELDTEAGNPNPNFHEWLQHPQIDDYWKRIALTPDQVAGVKLPTLVITGSHDGDQGGTLSFYKDHLTADGAMASNYFLVVGPWDHSGTRDPRPEAGGEHFGPASVIDVLKLHREWYRHVLQGGPKPAFFQKNVAYYVAGANAECWRFADSLAGATAKTETLYLNAKAGGENVAHAGALQASAAGAVGGQWVSDPADLRHAEPEKVDPGDDLHGDGLVFEGAPLAAATELTGKVDLKLSLAIDGPDADLAAVLFLVTKDGKLHELSESLARARYRKSLEHEELVTPGKVETYDMGSGLWFSVRAPAGSHLRLLVESLNDPSAEKNWNAAKPVAEQTLADAHRETIRLVQTADHPSTLTLPIGDTAGVCKASASW
jgi:hypothetical protein